MHAVLLPTGPLERTIDLTIDDWTEGGWPEALALSVVHGSPEALVHDGQHYEVQAVGATHWKLVLVLPGGLGVYSRSATPRADAHPVFLSDPLPAAAAPRFHAMPQVARATAADAARMDSALAGR